MELIGVPDGLSGDKSRVCLLGSPRPAFGHCTLIDRRAAAAKMN